MQPFARRLFASFFIHTLFIHSSLLRAGLSFIVLAGIHSFRTHFKQQTCFPFVPLLPPVCLQEWQWLWAFCTTHANILNDSRKASIIPIFCCTSAYLFHRSRRKPSRILLRHTAKTNRLRSLHLSILSRIKSLLPHVFLPLLRRQRHQSQPNHNFTNYTCDKSTQFWCCACCFL